MYRENHLWTVFLDQIFIKEEKVWKKWYSFLLGDCPDYIVKNKFIDTINRKKGELLGKAIVNFPVVYPIVLDNGYILQDIPTDEKYNI